jgi:hypothetical protein
MPNYLYAKNKEGFFLENPSLSENKEGFSRKTLPYFWHINNLAYK